MRNFHRGYKNNTSRSDSNFTRNDRRNDRNNHYQSNNDSYKRPADKGFNRSFSDHNKRPRRDFDNEQPSRGSYNQDRRDNNRGGRSFGGSHQTRSFRDDRLERSFRNQTPPRSRDREYHSDARFSRSSDTRSRQLTPPPPTSTSTSFRRRPDFQPSTIRPRTTRGGISTRGLRQSGSRILRRNDLRSNLISKRSVPTIRSREYIKKIKQARLKLSESSYNKSKDDDEPQTPPKESEKEAKNDDIDEDFLDVANDVNFEEDDDENVAKNSTVAKEETAEMPLKEEDEKTSPEKAKSSGAASTSERERKRDSATKSPSKEKDLRSVSMDLTCVHCAIKCTSVQDFRYHLTRRQHMMAMKKVSIKARLTLNRLRKVQRDRQLEIEARLKNVENIPSKYCQICKLYYRQSKIEHRDSEDHKKIRNFLKPYCKICHVQLLSAMKYEIHRCTIDHLKRKAKKHETTDDEIDLQELDLGDFKTVDSIGDVDGEEVESDDDDFESKDTDAVGQEFVNKIEVNYCSLCREYLSRSAKDDKVISDHCRSKKHLKWYFQSKKKDEKDLLAKANGGETSEVAKETVTSTSAQENGKASRKLVASDKDKDAKKVVVSKEAADGEKRDSDEVTAPKADESVKTSSKFTRYFEVTPEVNE